MMKKLLSERVSKIEESGIRRVFDLATRHPGQYVNLSIGQPHFPVSDSLKANAKEAIENNFNAYSPTQGLPVLREKIAKKLREKNKISAEAENVIVTAGVSGAIFLALASLINPGDEVILPDPYFVLYKEVLEFLEAKVVFLDTYPDFHINHKKLENLITDKTKALILNSPGNPTGAVFEKEELEKIAKVCQKHNLLIISDEIYEDFDYENKFVSVGSFYGKVLTLNGFSKSHAITGWRVGYAHGPKEIISAMNKLQQYTFVCAPTFAQAALAEQENLNPTFDASEYKRKRDYVFESLKDYYDLNITEGAFYFFIKIPEGRENFIEEAIENKLLVVFGSVFSRRNDYFRVSFAVNDETLEKGVSILKKIAG